MKGPSLAEVATAKVREAQRLVRLQRSYEAEGVAGDAKALFGRLEDQSGIANANYFLLQAALLEERINDGAKIAEEGLELARKSGNKLDEVKMLRASLLVKLAEGKPLDALEIAAKAEGLLVTLEKNHKEAGEVLLLVAQAHMLQGTTVGQQAALNAALQAVDHFAKAEEGRGEADSWRVVGDARVALGKFEDGLRATEAAMVICVDCGDEVGQALCLLSLSKAHLVRGLPLKAKKASEKALNLFHEQSSDLLAAAALEILVQALIGQEQRKEALQRAKQELLSFLGSGDKWAVPRMRGCLVTALRSMDRKKEALSEAERALEAAEELTRGQASPVPSTLVVEAMKHVAVLNMLTGKVDKFKIVKPFTTLLFQFEAGIMRWLTWSLLPFRAFTEEACLSGECDGVGLLQTKGKEETAADCRGFEKCPEWPMPYHSGEYPKEYPWKSLTMKDFPPGFMLGVGTAAFQIEGAYNEGGRGASIWDTYVGANTVGMPGSVCSEAPCPLNSVMADKGATGNVANNHYHKYKEDVAMMKAIGLKYYRFSVAWPRIVPTGVVKDGINQEGIAFYHSLIDELIKSGITPIITIYHWDLPQGLLDMNFDSPNPPCDKRYKQGWYECVMSADNKPVPSGMNSMIVSEFLQYSEILLKEYGKKVKMWATFNEAWTFTHLASGYGKAPSMQPYMDVDVWPKVAGHNVILAHLKVVMKFREMQTNGHLTPGHRIFITNNQDWREPLTDKAEDIAAAHYLVEGGLGWYCDPIYGVNGVHDFPYSMKSTLPYMPKFSEEEKSLLKAYKPDAFGLNHYGTSFVAYDGGKYTITHGKLVQGKSSWLFRAAWGYRKLLNWVKNRYGADLEIWGTEAGWSDGIETALGGKNDFGRLTYYQEYLQEALNAIKEDGVKMKSFMAWSLMDNFEWEMGYSERFGCLWNEFLWETDPNAPSANSPIYNPYAGKISGKCGDECSRAKVSPGPSRAKGQTRHMRNSMLRLIEAWGVPEKLSGPNGPNEDFFQAATSVSICFGKGTYETEDGPVECSLESDVLSKIVVPA